MTTTNRLARNVDSIVGVLLTAGLVGTSTFIMPNGKDVFRAPKEILFEATGILVATALIVGSLFGGRLLSKASVRRPETLLALSVLIWATVAAAFSLRPSVSFESLRAIVSAVVVAYAFYLLAMRPPEARPFIARAAGLGVVFALGLLNSVIGAVQTLGWQPLELESKYADRHVGRTALIGNPNDVGAYLLIPTLAAFAYSTTLEGKPKLLARAIAVLLFSGILVSQTRTALIAFVAGFLVFVMIIGFRPRRPSHYVLPLVLVLAFGIAIPNFMSLDRVADAVEQRSFDRLISGRTVAFAAAVEMFRAHPFTGIGPGMFGREYMPYKIRAQEERYPSMKKMMNTELNFGEVHNDHLEILAETGIPGLILSWLVLGFVASRARGPAYPTVTPTETLFARRFSLPFATAFFVFALAQFPLQLAASRYVLMMFLGLIAGWSRADEGR